jgi:D-amino-acid dehydrogenase
MKIAIIGAGVVGVTTAYMLAKQGHDVSVFDREPGAAMESSFANGGQLSYGFASPMGSPDLIRKIPNILLGADPAFRLPSMISLEFLGWSMQFLNHCRAGVSRKDSEKLSHLAAQSGRVFQDILSETSFEFGHRRASKLVLLKSQSELDKAAKALSAEPVRSGKKVLSWQQCLEVEPNLARYTGNAVGGLWVDGDEVGDAAQFSEQLAETSRKQFGARFQFNANVTSVEPLDDGGHEIVLLSDERIRFDAVVFCTGVAGTKLLKQLNIKLPIYPVMGYSLTAPVGEGAPEIAVTDAGYKIVFSRIGDQVRIAGFADFGIASEERRRQRIQELIETARRLIPDVADYSQIKSTWIGARPATPSSLPVVGQTKRSGIYLNMGHGMFGWTLSAGAAQMLADLIGPATQVSQAA